MDENFYRKVLSRGFKTYEGLITAAELAQEADLQNKEVMTWSSGDLLSIPGLRTALLTCRRLGLHSRHGGVDIGDHENPTHRTWSLNEVRLGIDFALRLGADVCILHPGTYNERSGRFWPRPEEVRDFLSNRWKALENSLAELAGHLASKALEQERRLRHFEEEKPRVFSEMTNLLKELAMSDGGEERISLLHRGLEVIESADLSPEQIRHCQRPWGGMHICLENLEPPNFLVNTPEQISKIHERFDQFFLEAADHGGLSEVSTERYRPKLAIDPGHLLNSKVILTQESNRVFLEAIDGGEDLYRDFVRLPGQYTSRSDGSGVQEPLLNRFVRLHHDKILWAYLYGSSRTDTCMTTHGPIKPFRSSSLLERGSHGEVVKLYSTGNYNPKEELNLEEVVQNLGVDLTYIAEVFDSPVEVVKGSCINTHHYLDYLGREYLRAAEGIRRKIKEISKEDLGEASKARLQAVAEHLVNARSYLRPKPGSSGFWSVGYDEVGYYRYIDSPEEGNLDIFATVKQDGRVWLKGFEDQQ